MTQFRKGIPCQACPCSPHLRHLHTPRLDSQTLLSIPPCPSELLGNKPGLAWPQMGAAGRILAPLDSSSRGWGLQEAWREGPPRPPGRCLSGVAHPIPAGKGVWGADRTRGVRRVGISEGPGSSLLLCQGDMAPGLRRSGSAGLDRG